MQDRHTPVRSKMGLSVGCVGSVRTHHNLPHPSRPVPETSSSLNASLPNPFPSTTRNIPSPPSISQNLSTPKPLTRPHSGVSHGVERPQSGPIACALARFEGTSRVQASGRRRLDLACKERVIEGRRRAGLYACETIMGRDRAAGGLFAASVRREKLVGDMMKESNESGYTERQKRER